MGFAKQIVEGWFSTDGRLGDRTLDQQMKGLGPLIERVPGKTVLDVGCAEGLIAMKLYDEGASAVHGLEIVPGHAAVANKLRADRGCTFDVADANAYKPKRKYDIVIMLAILHKLTDPTAACKRFASAARELVVLRLPPRTAPVIVDRRSGNYSHDMEAALETCGFFLTRKTLGHMEEWVGFFEKG